MTNTIAWRSRPLAPPLARTPWLDEFRDGRMGDEIEAALRFDVARWLFREWTTFHSDEAWLVPGCRWAGESSSGGMLGDPAKLRGAEIFAQVSGIWRRLDARCGGLFIPVRRAVIERAEMKELAPPDTPLKKRAAAGRGQFIQGLDAVGAARLEMRWIDRYGVPMAANDNFAADEDEEAA